MRATEILFESRAAVLKAEAEAKLLEKQIELEVVKKSSKELALLKEQNEALREWIRDAGVQTDTCTYNILREKCSYCRCHRSKS